MPGTGLGIEAIAEQTDRQGVSYPGSSAYQRERDPRRALSEVVTFGLTLATPHEECHCINVPVVIPHFIFSFLYDEHSQLEKPKCRVAAMHPGKQGVHRVFIRHSEKQGRDRMKRIRQLQVPIPA